ncbi:MAG: rhodanese-like domain-containing protein [Alphaproteobacteria bacterium]|nr:rhodanese-like domain-containing protein [Alphaproteobacteria bacterium]MBE8220298.1 rhodanese-like domain-containing protein [Alphaproteobacteria bacterium]
MPEEDNTFAGHVSPAICWQTLCAQAQCHLVDVRTRPEWAFVGTADMAQAQGTLIMAEWQNFPTMQENQGFVEEVSAAVADKSVPLFFLCRSGARSLAAAVAMTQAGFAQCYNVVGGFEGDIDAHNHRGQMNGWKSAGCPWIQK